MSFNDLGLIEPLLQSLQDQQYTTPTDIQRQAIPPLIDGRDLIGCAQTGTGKTAAFALPILQRLHLSPPAPPSDEAPSQLQKTPKSDRRGRGRRKNKPASLPKGDGRPPRALILTPTRELAAQVADSFKTYGTHLGLRFAVVFGGVSQMHQVRALQNGIDILIATPGRLKDLHEQGHIDLSYINIFTLDEADRMLDMGFLPDIKRIAAMLPDQRQTLLFSATMPPAIRSLTRSLLTDPVSITIEAKSPAAETVQQAVAHIAQNDKIPLLVQLLEDPTIDKAIIFSRTKHGADRLVRLLRKHEIPSEAIHGDKTQAQRTRALANFTSGRSRLLIASDVAARGIDVDDITHVFNFDIPRDPDSYIHRIGRTGRAGASGTAITFCTAEDHTFLRAIQRAIGRDLDIVDHDFDVPQPSAAAPRSSKPKRPKHPLAKTGGKSFGKDRNYYSPKGGNKGGKGKPFGKPKQRTSRSGK